MKFECPSCGAPGNIISPISLFYTCPFCRNQVFKNENQLESVGKVAELPADMSPLQLYSQGTLNNRQFTVVGRVKLQWSDGYWNEWYLSYNDGSSAWLAEAQGEWIYSVQIHDLQVPSFSKSSIGKSFNYNGASFTFADFKESFSYGFEGELPFKTVLNEPRKSIDLLSGASPRFLSFESDASGSRAYLGQYITLADLRMQNLRRFDGWSA